MACQRKKISCPSMKTYLTIQHFQDQGGAASLRYRKPLLNHRSYVLTKSLIRYGFRAGARAFLYTVVTVSYTHLTLPTKRIV